MKIVKLKFGIGLLAIFLLTFSSCKEDFSPFTNLEDKYVLFCALSVFPDAGFNMYTVSVDLSKIYFKEGGAASASTDNLYLNDAVINLSAGSKSYVLKLKKIINQTDSLNNGIQYVYSADGVVIKGSDKISISAKLANGKVLSASTQVPTEFEVKMSYPFQEGFSSKIDRFLWGTSLTFTWKTTTYGHIFFPKFEIYYYNAQTNTYGIKEVASKYIQRNGGYEPYYPTYQLVKSVSFDYDAVDSAMAQIAKNDPERKNKIYYLKGSVMEFDTPLSNYYTGIHGRVDQFSIRLDQGLYTNINGGIGVLGVGCISKTGKIFFREEYLQKFGYSFVEE